MLRHGTEAASLTRPANDATRELDHLFANRLTTAS
jgi:hypothetical protein